MFKRFTAIVVVIFILSFSALSLSWKNIPGAELPSSNPEIKAYRIVQDLGGEWSSYLTLRQAWTQENSVLHGKENSFPGLFKADSFVLPSTQGFVVAAKQFTVTGKWGYSTPRFVLKGVYGKIRVFLNGIDEINLLGEFKGNGGEASIDFSSARLNYNKTNLVFIEISKDTTQQNKIFGWLWPEQERITGQIRMEAVPETTIEDSKITVSYNSTLEQVTTGVTVRHHQTLDKGPWVISGVLNQEGKKVAECVLPLTSDSQEDQTVNLIFKLPGIHLWSVQDPYLYELELRIKDNTGETDSVQLPVGFRNGNVSTGKWGLNGKEMKLQGIILSQDQENKIRNQRQIENFLRTMKAKGDNCLYFMGFFPDEEWLYTADKLGVGIWLELPVSLVAKTKIPDPVVFEDMVLMSKKHPSVLAWTAAKGLEPSTFSVNYLQKVMNKVSPLPAYQLVFNQASAKTDELVIFQHGLEGEWGRVDYYSAVSPDKGLVGGWKNEKAAAIAWLFWLIFLSVQKIRSRDWNYRELFNSNPKRVLRTSFFWSSLAFVSRMGTIGAVFTSLLFKIPSSMPPWLPYDVGWIRAIQNQPPLLMWLLISSFMIVYRLLKVGIAVTAFPQNPDPLGLACWLERTYYWVILVGIAWVLVVFGFPSYLPIAVYILFSIIFLPIRIRDTWKIKGKYSTLWVVPITILILVILILIFCYQDFIYLGKMLLPLINFNEIFR